MQIGYFLLQSLLQINVQKTYLKSYCALVHAWICYLSTLWYFQNVSEHTTAPWYKHKLLYFHDSFTLGCKKYMMKSEYVLFFSASTGPRWLVPPYVLQPCWLTVLARLWKFPLALPVVPSHLRHERPLAGKRGNYGWDMAGNFADKWRIPCHLKGPFTCCKSVTWDRWLYFPSKGRHAEDFFALKNPMASAGFEPANLGTRGQHATPRPPKPLSEYVEI
jgi:hypothetical protein